MKHFFTISLCFLALSLSAQVPVEFPWNPDQDGDDLIGVNDLAGLLSVYGLEFSEEGLYVSENEQAAVIAFESMNFFDCQKKCNDIPSQWWIPRVEDFSEISPADIYANTGVELLWINYINSPIADRWLLEVNDFLVMALSNNGTSPIISSQAASNSFPCVCITKERPKVEYAQCTGDSPDDTTFLECITEKLSEGWYPLSGWPLARDKQGYTGNTGTIAGYYPQTHASFWRWAE